MAEVSGPLVRFVPASSKDGHLRFLGYFEKEEVVAVEVDVSRSGGPAIITELYVVEEWREHGFGSEALLKAEEAARDGGRNEICVKAAGKDAEVERWFRLRGFAPATGQPGTMRKALPG